jgi:hypothetical protein
MEDGSLGCLSTMLVGRFHILLSGIESSVVMDLVM